jgi:hypothetical protein
MDIFFYKFTLYIYITIRLMIRKCIGTIFEILELIIDMTDLV